MNTKLKSIFQKAILTLIFASVGVGLYGCGSCGDHGRRDTVSLNGPSFLAECLTFIEYRYSRAYDTTNPVTRPVERDGVDKATVDFEVANTSPAAKECTLVATSAAMLVGNDLHFVTFLDASGNPTAAPLSFGPGEILRLRIEAGPATVSGLEANTLRLTFDLARTNEFAGIVDKSVSAWFGDSTTTCGGSFSETPSSFSKFVILDPATTENLDVTFSFNPLLCPSLVYEGRVNDYSDPDSILTIQSDPVAQAKTLSPFSLKYADFRHFPVSALSTLISYYIFSSIDAGGAKIYFYREDTGGIDGQFKVSINDPCIASGAFSSNPPSITFNGTPGAPSVSSTATISYNPTAACDGRDYVIANNPFSLTSGAPALLTINIAPSPPLTGTLGSSPLTWNFDASVSPWPATLPAGVVSISEERRVELSLNGPTALASSTPVIANLNQDPCLDGLSVTPTSVSLVGFVGGPDVILALSLKAGPNCSGGSFNAQVGWESTPAPQTTTSSATLPIASVSISSASFTPVTTFTLYPVTLQVPAAVNSLEVTNIVTGASLKIPVLVTVRDIIPPPCLSALTIKNDVSPFPRPIKLGDTLDGNVTLTNAINGCNIQFISSEIESKQNDLHFGDVKDSAGVAVILPGATLTPGSTWTFRERAGAATVSGYETNNVSFSITDGAVGFGIWSFDTAAWFTEFPNQCETETTITPTFLSLSSIPDGLTSNHTINATSTTNCATLVGEIYADVTDSLGLLANLPATFPLAITSSLIPVDIASFSHTAVGNAQGNKFLIFGDGSIPVKYFDKRVFPIDAVVTNPPVVDQCIANLLLTDALGNPLPLDLITTVGSTDADDVLISLLTNPSCLSFAANATFTPISQVTTNPNFPIALTVTTTPQPLSNFLLTGVSPMTLTTGMIRITNPATGEFDDFQVRAQVTSDPCATQFTFVPSSAVTLDGILGGASVSGSIDVTFTPTTACSTVTFNAGKVSTGPGGVLTSNGPLSGTFAGTIGVPTTVTYNADLSPTVLGTVNHLWSITLDTSTVLNFSFIGNVTIDPCVSAFTILPVGAVRDLTAFVGDPFPQDSIALQFTPTSACPNVDYTTTFVQSGTIPTALSVVGPASGTLTAPASIVYNGTLDTSIAGTASDVGTMRFTSGGSIGFTFNGTVSTRPIDPCILNLAFSTVSGAAFPLDLNTVIGGTDFETVQVVENPSSSCSSFNASVTFTPISQVATSNPSLPTVMTIDRTIKDLSTFTLTGGFLMPSTPGTVTVTNTATSEFKTFQVNAQVVDDPCVAAFRILPPTALLGLNGVVGGLAPQGSIRFEFTPTAACTSVRFSTTYVQSGTIPAALTINGPTVGGPLTIPTTILYDARLDTASAGTARHVGTMLLSTGGSLTFTVDGVVTQNPCAGLLSAVTVQNPIFAAVGGPTQYSDVALTNTAAAGSACSSIDGVVTFQSATLAGGTDIRVASYSFAGVQPGQTHTAMDLASVVPSLTTQESGMLLATVMYGQAGSPLTQASTFIVNANVQTSVGNCATALNFNLPSVIQTAMGTMNTLFGAITNTDPNCPRAYLLLRSSAPLSGLGATLDVTGGATSVAYGQTIFYPNYLLDGLAATAPGIVGTKLVEIDYGDSVATRTNTVSLPVQAEILPDACAGNISINVSPTIVGRPGTIDTFSFQVSNSAAVVCNIDLPAQQIPVGAVGVLARLLPITTSVPAGGSVPINNRIEVDARFVVPSTGGVTVGNLPIEVRFGSGAIYTGQVSTTTLVSIATATWTNCIVNTVSVKAIPDANPTAQVGGAPVFRSVEFSGVPANCLSGVDFNWNGTSVTLYGTTLALSTGVLTHLDPGQTIVVPDVVTLTPGSLIATPVLATYFVFTPTIPGAPTQQLQGPTFQGRVTSSPIPLASCSITTPAAGATVTGDMDLQFDISVPSGFTNYSINYIKGSTSGAAALIAASSTGAPNPASWVPDGAQTFSWDTVADSIGMSDSEQVIIQIRVTDSSPTAPVRTSCFVPVLVNNSSAVACRQSPTMCGDIDSTGSVTINDALLVAQVASRVGAYPADIACSDSVNIMERCLAGNVNGDSSLSGPLSVPTSDAGMIASYVAGVPTAFACNSLTSILNNSKPLPLNCVDELLPTGFCLAVPGRMSLADLHDPTKGFKLYVATPASPGADRVSAIYVPNDTTTFSSLSLVSAPSTTIISSPFSIATPHVATYQSTGPVPLAQPGYLFFVTGYTVCGVIELIP